VDFVLQTAQRYNKIKVEPLASALPHHYVKSKLSPLSALPLALVHHHPKSYLILCDLIIANLVHLIICILNTKLKNQQCRTETIFQHSKAVDKIYEKLA
jgi:hypothetical protein